MNNKNNRMDIQSENEALIAGICKDDKSCFEKVFKAHWGWLYRQAIKKVRSPELAEELVQDVFVKLWTKRGNLHIVDLKKYLSLSLRNKVIDKIRSDGNIEKYWQYYRNYFPLHSESNQETIYYTDLSEKIEAGLMILPEKSRSIFRLNRFEGLTVKEIAKKFQVSEKAIEYHITRSVKTLQVHLKEFILGLIVLAEVI